MRHRAFLLLYSILLLLACEEVIQVDLDDAPPRLVIDAIIGYSENNGSPITIGQVQLSLSTPFFEEESPAALGATVSIINEDTGEVFPLEESDPGRFIDGFPALIPGTSYTLEVIFEGNTYRATEQLVGGTQIDNLEQGDGFLFDQESETEVKVTFTDFSDERNFYLFSFGFDNFLIIDDEFFPEQQITFSYFYEDLEPGDQLSITLLGADKEFADYVNVVLDQAGQSNNGSAGGFSTPPAEARGNIVNTTNAEQYPLGYFAISEFDIELLTIQ